MRVMLLTYESWGDVESMMELAMQLQTISAAVRMSAPVGCAELLPVPMGV